MLELINGAVGPGGGRRAGALPLFHFVGLPLGLMRRPRPAPRGHSERPINVDDDDDGSDNAIPSIDSDDDGLEPRRVRRTGSSDESMVDSNDEDDSVGFRGFMGSPFGRRHFMSSILDRMAQISALTRTPVPPPPPPRPLRHIREGDRTIIDLTDDDPEPSRGSAIPNFVPRPLPRRATADEVITVIDDDDDAPQAASPAPLAVAPAPVAAPLQAEDEFPVSDSSRTSRPARQSRQHARSGE
jgi:hypothetical protein